MSDGNVHHAHAECRTCRCWRITSAHHLSLSLLRKVSNRRDAECLGSGTEQGQQAGDRMRVWEDVQRKKRKEERKRKKK